MSAKHSAPVPHATGNRAELNFDAAVKKWWAAQRAEEAKKRVAAERKLAAEEGRKPSITLRDQALAAQAGIRAGKAMDGFLETIVEALLEVKVDLADIYPRLPGSKHLKMETHLPAYFRASKKWDLIVCKNSLHKTAGLASAGRPKPVLIAAIEFKSQFESIGKNQNNRIEECLGSALDLWSSHRCRVLGAKKHEPWLGYLFVGKYNTRSASDPDWKPIDVAQPHIPADAAFTRSGARSWDAIKVPGISYAERYEVFLNRVKSEGLVDGACFITTHAGHHQRNAAVRYECPFEGLDQKTFLGELQRHVLANYHDDPVALLAPGIAPARKRKN